MHVSTLKVYKVNFFLFLQYANIKNKSVWRAIELQSGMPERGGEEAQLSLSWFRVCQGIEVSSQADKQVVVRELY